MAPRIRRARIRSFRAGTFPPAKKSLQAADDPAARRDEFQGKPGVFIDPMPGDRFTAT
ncbi:hypothetical protein B4135_4287 [Caldibacillus debilis]|uniref:Uncharacterized protein n=1 Tax=Caldibacillus debilis TaxID=301148 RepID=A0A150L6I4_9BACI|nr:hypothetical protein B4135_4287 [Caldibacillus debilis]